MDRLRLEYEGKSQDLYLWRGGRVVYGSGLENQRGCKPTVSSNLTLSAFKPSQPSPRLGFLMSEQGLYPATRSKQSTVLLSGKVGLKT